MDPARDTVVSSLYKGLGGALDKTAVYDEEDQLLILSDMSAPTLASWLLACGSVFVYRSPC